MYRDKHGRVWYVDRFSDRHPGYAVWFRNREGVPTCAWEITGRGASYKEALSALRRLARRQRDWEAV